MGGGRFDTIRQLYGFIRPARLYVWVSVLVGLTRIAASLLFVWVCKELVDIVTGESDGVLNSHIAILLGVMVYQILSSLFASWWENRSIVRTGNRIRYDCFSYVLKSEWNGKEEFHSGDVVSRLEDDVRVLVDLVCSKVPAIVITVCQLVAASVFLMKMAPQLVWLLIGLMVVGILGSKLFFRTLRRLSAEIREAESLAQQNMQENIQRRVLVLTMIGTKRVLEKFGLIQKDIEAVTVRRLNFNAVARGFMGFGFMSGYAAAFLWGIFGIRDGSITYGMMTAFLQLVGQVQKPVADMAGYIPAIIHAMTSCDRITELYSLKSPEDEDSGTMEKTLPGIEFKDVVFSYPGRPKTILDDFSFYFRPGELTAITGPTGKGKSTLVRLALGLLKPQRGSVSRYAMCNFMYVPQGNSLMSGTIRENLMLARADATEEDMKKALKIAVADFVFELPDGLDSRCGEVGSGLSEGQAQRIAIARALLHKGGILILDESTSALDSDTEDRLLDNLSKEYRGKKTILFVSHRDTVSDAADAICSL